MTKEHVHRLLARAVIMAFDAGVKTAQEAGSEPVTPATLKEVAGAAIANATAIVMPAVAQLQEEATEDAVIEACRPYAALLFADANAEADAMQTRTPGPGSPLFSPWLHGVLRASDAIARRFGGIVDRDKAAEAVVDGVDLVDSIAASIEQQARARVLQ
jgi:hypothetical protein